MTAFRKLDETLSVAGQLSPADFQRAADEGFTLIINNRPDGEAPDQIADNEARMLAASAGLTYVHLPIRMAELSMQDITATSDALAGATGPALAYCASGARSTALWALACARAGDDPVALLHAAQAAGVDIENLAPTLERLSADAKAARPSST